MCAALLLTEHSALLGADDDFIVLRSLEVEAPQRPHHARLRMHGELVEVARDETVSDARLRVQVLRLDRRHLKVGRVLGYRRLIVYSVAVRHVLYYRFSYTAENGP